MRLKPWVKILFFFLIIGTFFYFVPEIYDYFKDFKIVKDVKEKIESIDILNKGKEEKEKKYQACLNAPYNNEIDVSELDTYINNNYRMSVKYVDLKTGFTYAYNMLLVPLSY